MIELEGGKLGTDTTFLEAHLEEMRKGFTEALLHLKKSVEELQEHKADASTPDDVRAAVTKAVKRCSTRLEGLIEERAQEIEQSVKQRLRQVQRQPSQFHQRRLGFK